MLSYSVAIRTLGRGGDVFRRELENIALQSVQPEKVLVYIAEGCPRPDFQIGKEEYVWVVRGMMSQRLRHYDEIESDCILMLDDDVSLQPDSVQRLLEAMEENDADCVGADTFATHELPLYMKIYVAISNFVFPHCDDRWAFKIRRDGSFSYNNRPRGGFSLSQSCAGNVMLWRKNAYEQLHFEDEMWLDELPFAYNDDMLESYKVYKNGFILGVLYDSGCCHVDVRSASNAFRRDPKWLKARTAAGFIIWRRVCFDAEDGITERIITYTSFCFKLMWMFVVFVAMSVVKLDANYVGSYFTGLRAGYDFVNSTKFKALRQYTFLKHRKL